MKKFSLIPLALAALLGACTSGEQQVVEFNNQTNAGLIYAYPYLAQREVPTHAPVVLRFSEALTNSHNSLVTDVKLLDANGQAVDIAISTADEGRSLVLTPSSALAPKTRYTIQANGLQTASGSVQLPADFSFTTRAAQEGPASMTSLSEDFSLVRMIPDGTSLPIMDFSSLRLQFSQPLDQTSLKYGDNLRLETADGELVAASILAQGHYLTIDPVEDLKAGHPYKLVFGNSLKSTLNKSLLTEEAAELTIIPKDSHPREIMAQFADDSNGEIRSILTGELINAVPVKALLLGDESVSQQVGEVRAELAFVPNYPEVTPLRIPKGSLLLGSSVKVMINGKVPAGFETGGISVTFVSDANGFLLPNRYSNDETAPRHVQLYMDLAMTTAESRANGALSQDLLHVELVGTAIVQNGAMVINAVGVVEPKALGLETAYGTLSFHMEAYRDQENVKPLDPDQDAPVLLSWVPGVGHINKQRPGDPIILNFNEPLDRASLELDGAWTLYKGNSVVPKEAINWRLDGGSLIIEPKEYLQFGTRYRVELTSLITDLAGNPLIPEKNPVVDFTMAQSVSTNSGNARAPFALTVYPGFPCAMTARDLANGFQGRCSGGQTSDDLIPISTMPADRSIVVRFSQDMNPNSIQLRSSFRVERVNTSGTKLGDVPGQLKVDSRSLTFTPDEPWVEGQLYRYILVSQTSGSCSNGGAICSKAGYPLQTAFLTKPDATAGGPDMEIYFRGVAPVKTVFNPLYNLPTYDVNANLTVDSGEHKPTFVAPNEGVKVGRENTVYLTSNNAGIGCKSGQSCPGENYLILQANLDTEVIGWDEKAQAVKVKLYPTVLMTSSVTVHAEIIGEWVQKAAPTGPQMMRMRYQKGNNCTLLNEPRCRTELIDGYIYNKDGKPRFRTEVEVYLDAPYLNPDIFGIGLSHNLHSYKLTPLKLDGAITFFEDGRMQIEQYNTNEISINTEIGTIVRPKLTIPKYGNFLNYTSRIIKD